MRRNRRRSLNGKSLYAPHLSDAVESAYAEAVAAGRQYAEATLNAARVAAATLRVSIPELQAHSDELVIKQMDALRASDRKRHKSVMAQIERVSDTLLQHVAAKSWGG